MTCTVSPRRAVLAARHTPERALSRASDDARGRQRAAAAGGHCWLVAHTQQYMGMV